VRDLAPDKYAVTIKRYLPFLIMGIIALALIYIFYSLTTAVVIKENSMFDHLEGLGDRSFDLYRSQWDILLLVVFTSAVTMFAAGFISAAFVRSGSSSVGGRLKAALVTGIVPALAIDVYLLIRWYNDVQLFNRGGTIDGRPFEPMIPPVMLLIVALITAFCLGFSLAGGLLSRVALAHK